MFFMIYNYVHTGVQSDAMSSLVDEGYLETANSHDVPSSTSHTKTTIEKGCSFQFDSSSTSSDLDDDILPLFERIQLQQQHSDLSDNHTFSSSYKKPPVQHVGGTPEFPIVLD